MSALVCGSVRVCEGRSYEKDKTYDVSAMANVGRVMRLSDVFLLKKSLLRFGYGVKQRYLVVVVFGV